MEDITIEVLEGMSKSELVEYAAGQDIEVRTSAKKDVIINEIAEALDLKAVEPAIVEAPTENKKVRKFINKTLGL